MNKSVNMLDELKNAIKNRSYVRNTENSQAHVWKMISVRDQYDGQTLEYLKDNETLDYVADSCYTFDGTNYKKISEKEELSSDVGYWIKTKGSIIYKEIVKELTGDRSNLSDIPSEIYGQVSSQLIGSAKNIKGDVSNITGDVSNISGDVSDIIGDVSKIYKAK